MLSLFLLTHSLALYWELRVSRAEGRSKRIKKCNHHHKTAITARAWLLGVFKFPNEKTQCYTVAIKLALTASKHAAGGKCFCWMRTTWNKNKEWQNFYTIDEQADHKLSMWNKKEIYTRILFSPIVQKQFHFSISFHICFQ